MDTGILKKFFTHLVQAVLSFAGVQPCDSWQLFQGKRVLWHALNNTAHLPLTLSPDSHLRVNSPSFLLLPAMAFLLQLSFWSISSSNVYYLIWSMISASQQRTSLTSWFPASSKGQPDSNDSFQHGILPPRLSMQHNRLFYGHGINLSSWILAVLYPYKRHAYILKDVQILITYWKKILAHLN